MCKALKPCQKSSGQDCGDCFTYDVKVFSPEDSFNFNGKLCDCILECDGLYLLVEIKKGRLNIHEVKDAIEQLNNCETQLKIVCGGLANCSKVLLFDVYAVPPAKKDMAERLLRKHDVKTKTMKNVKGRLCEYFRM